MRRAILPANKSSETMRTRTDVARLLPCMQRELELLEHEVMEGARNMIKRLVRMCVEEVDRG